MSTRPINPSIAVMSVLTKIHQIKPNGYSKYFDVHRVYNITRAHGFKMTNEQIDAVIAALEQKKYIKMYRKDNKVYICTTETGRAKFNTYITKEVV